MSESKSLMDVALAVDALIDKFGRDSMGCEIPLYEADERRGFEKSRNRQRRRDEYLREEHKKKRPRRAYGKAGQGLKPPHEGWVPVVGWIAVDEASPPKRKAGKRSKPKKVDDEYLHVSKVAYFGPPDLVDPVDETKSAERGLIASANTHGQRCVLLLAVHRRVAIWEDDTFDPGKVSFLGENEQGRGYGPYAILVVMVDDLSESDVPALMRMVEKVRKEFESKNVQAVTAAGDEGDDPLVSTRKLAEMFGLSPSATRKRLERWRKTHFGGWSELDNVKPREPKLLYRLSAVRPVLSRPSYMKSSADVDRRMSGEKN